MSDTPRIVVTSPPEASGTPVRTVRITWGSAVLAVSLVIGLVVLRNGFVAAHRILGWTAASIAVAVFVEPIIDYLDRFVPRAVAVILTFLVMAGAAGALVFGTVDDLDREVSRLRETAPRAIADLEARDDELGRFATEIDLSARAETFLDALDERVGSGSGALAENAPAAPIYFVSAILTIFLLVYGPGIAHGAAGQLDDERHRRLMTEVLSRAAHRARRTVSALIAQGAVVGLATFGLGTALDLPAPIVLGLIAGVAGMLPDVGILLGVLPTVSLVAALETTRLAVVVLVVAFGLQAAEALYIRRKVSRFGVELGPAVVWIVAVVGYTIYGPGMAFYGVAYAIFFLAVMDQVPEVRAELELGDT